jgi:hypothetical protein
MSAFLTGAKSAIRTAGAIQPEDVEGQFACRMLPASKQSNTTRQRGHNLAYIK